MTDGDLAGVDRTAATDAGRGRLRAAAALATALGGAGYLYGHPPYGEASLVPPCPLQALTGLECPLCGATRMTYELLHGDPAAAFALNPVLLTALPLILLWAGWWWWQAVAHGRRVPGLSGAQGRAVLVAAVVWACARNLARLV